MKNTIVAIVVVVMSVIVIKTHRQIKSYALMEMMGVVAMKIQKIQDVIARMIVIGVVNPMKIPEKLIGRGR
jgi:hypothetical protein